MAVPASAQLHLMRYQRDPAFYNGVSQWEVGGLALRPDGNAVMTGWFSGTDVNGGSFSSFFFMETDTNGAPLHFSHYKDTAVFVFLGSRGYGITLDANGNALVAGSANNWQMITQVDPTGAFNWGRAVHHHEYHHIKVLGDGSIIALGQDESMVGIHDYALVRINPAGDVVEGMMYGTTDTDVPGQFDINSEGDYVMIGSGRDSSRFVPMVYQASSNFAPEWGFLYIPPNNEDVLGTTGFVDPTTDDFIFSGQVASSSQPDSVYFLRVNAAGQIQAQGIYGAPNGGNLQVTDMAFDGTHCYIAGSYVENTYWKGLLMKTDLNGDLIWAKEIAPINDSTDSFVREVEWDPQTRRLTLAGDGKEYINGFTYPFLMMARFDADSGELSCIKDMAFSKRPISFTAQSLMQTEAFFANNPQGYDRFNTGVDSITLCRDEIIIGVESPAPTPSPFVVQHGSDRWLLDWEGLPVHFRGECRLFSLAGQQLGTWNLAQPAGRLSINQGDFPSGIYLLQVQGVGIAPFQAKIWRP